MSDLIISRAALDFWLFDWLDVTRDGAMDRATADGLLDLAARLAAEAFLPHYRLADVHEPALGPDGVAILPEIKAALRHYVDLGLVGATFPEDLGGMGVPPVIGQAMFALFASANVAAMAYPMLTVGNAKLIARYGSTAQVDMFARPQIAGRWFGTMCLSEPQAGSSLTEIRTAARFEDADALGRRYRLAGNKMWISGGDQDFSENIVHLVLAKTVQADGTLATGIPGISLFIVPKILPDGTRNDVAVAGLNHKMGYRGTSNCLLNFGEGAGATGWLVGAEGQGLAQMFMMMNDARIGVGLGAAALAYRGYRHAVGYARERVQGRLPGARGGQPVAIIEHADVRRMLLQAKCYAEGALALGLYCAQLEGADEDLLALLTPVAKSWPSEFGLMANDLAIQVHGGYGYTRDFDVEQLWRDNRLNPIHEGTTGVQALDLLRRKLLGGGAGALAPLLARIGATSAAAAGRPELDGHGRTLGAYWERIEQVLGSLRGLPGDAAPVEATNFLRAFGHGVVAWLWLDQALVTASDPAVMQCLRHATDFFFSAELPQGLAWLTVVESRSAGAMAVPDTVFA